MKPLNLNQLRKKIDDIDAAIIKKLAQRQKISKNIGKLKAKTGKPVFDLARERRLILLYERLCEQYKLSTVFVKRLFKIILAHSKKLQK